MKLKFYYIIYLTITSFLIGMSCSEYLDRPDANFVEEQNFWRNEKDAIAALAGVYDGFQSRNLMGEMYRTFDRMTDNAITAGSPDWLAFEVDELSPSNVVLERMWSDYYIIISRANRLIKNVPLIEDISPDNQNRIVAEAKFLRAYAYYDLCMLWGDVPFYLLPKRSVDKPEAPSKKENIFSYMIEELDEIADDLPETLQADELGRAPKAAVQALLGKYYLTNKQYSEAADVLDNIIESKLFELHPDYAALFTTAGEFSKENIFEINFDASSIDEGEYFSVRIDTLAAPLVPSRLWKPLPDLVESYLLTDGKPIKNHPLYGNKSPLYDNNNRFENRDPRLRVNVFTNADNTPGGKKIWNWTGVNTFAVKKYTLISNQQFTNGGPQNYYLIRYADVLLMYAEAQNEAIGPDQSVHTAMNTVRRRVQMPDIPTGLNQDDMRQYIRDERRWEFAGEHQRFFDLRRWGILSDRAMEASNKKIYDPIRALTWPYPQLEMDKNAALKAMGQNDGY